MDQIKRQDVLKLPAERGHACAMLSLRLCFVEIQESSRSGPSPSNSPWSPCSWTTRRSAWAKRRVFWRATLVFGLSPLRRQTRCFPTCQTWRASWEKCTARFMTGNRRASTYSLFTKMRLLTNTSTNFRGWAYKFPSLMTTPELACSRVGWLRA